MNTDYHTAIPQMPLDEIRKSSTQNVSVFTLSILLAAICSIISAGLGYSVGIGFVAGFILFFSLLFWIVYRDQTLRVIEESLYNSFKKDNRVEKEDSIEDYIIKSRVCYPATSEKIKNNLALIKSYSVEDDSGTESKEKGGIVSPKTEENFSAGLFTPDLLFGVTSFPERAAAGFWHMSDEAVRDRQTLRRIQRRLISSRLKLHLAPSNNMVFGCMSAYYSVRPNPEIDFDEIREKISNLLKGWGTLSDEEKMTLLTDIWLPQNYRISLTKEDPAHRRNS